MYDLIPKDLDCERDPTTTCLSINQFSFYLLIFLQPRRYFERYKWISWFHAIKLG